MAELVTELLGEALAGAVRQYRSRLSERTQRFMAWLREAAEPPAGVELRSPDGSLYSGIALFERNDVRLMLAVRHDPGRAAQPYRSPIVTPPPRERSLYQGLLDPDDPRWDRDGDPFRR